MNKTINENWQTKRLPEYLSMKAAKVIIVYAIK